MSHAGAQPLLQSAIPVGGEPTPLAERGPATPRLACAALCRALNEGDLEAALARFSPDACLIRSDGGSSQGEAAIGSCLAELIDRGARVGIELRGVTVAADIALAHERWRIAYGGAPDPAAAKAPAPTLVLRRLEAEWKIAIAAPWGAPANPPLRAIWP